jgi:hypothetical protein
MDASFEYLPNITTLMYVNRRCQLDEFSPFCCLMKCFYTIHQKKKFLYPAEKGLHIYAMVWYSKRGARRFSSWLMLAFLQ